MCLNLGDYINVIINGKLNCYCFRGVEEEKKFIYIRYIIKLSYFI